MEADDVRAAGAKPIERPVIAPLEPEHVAQVARLHCSALTGLLTELGESASRAFYEGCNKAGAATGFVWLNAGEVRGFVLGSVRPDLLKGAVVRANPVATVAGVLGGILRRPAALVWILKSFKGPDQGSFDPAIPELTYLAVHAEERGSGVGIRLVDAFTQAMREAGVSAYELSVDDDNYRAIAFYEGRGFRPISRYREFGTLHRRYRLATSTTGR